MIEANDDVGKAILADMEAGGAKLQSAMKAHAEELAGQRPRTPVDRAAGNCMTRWLPILRGAYIPTPRTKIVDAGEDWHHLTAMLGESCDPNADTGRGKEILAKVVEGITAAGHEYGWPLFLRTSQFSGKHNWRETCFVRRAEDVRRHVLNLCEMSEMFGMFGELPYRYWAAREFLPTVPMEILPSYGGMPLVREIRFFIDGGRVVCHHPYWPRDSIRAGLDDRAERPKVSIQAQLLNEGRGGLLASITEGPEIVETPELLAEVAVLKARSEWLDNRSKALYDAALVGEGDMGGWLTLATRVAVAFQRHDTPEPWSVDILDTGGGRLYVTDMARAGESYHQAECPHAELGRAKRKAANGAERN